MKKTLIYIIVAIAAVVASCVRDPFENGPKGVPSDHTCITLKPVVVGPVTKADEPQTEDGDATYNENKISSYYWFVYSDAEGTDLKVSGFENSGDPVEVLLDDYFPTGGTAYVYVVANLPVKPEGTGDAEWFEYVAATETAPAAIKYVKKTGANESSRTYTGTLATLRTLEFGKNTPVENNAIVAGKSEFYNYTSATTGRPAPDSFVMRTTAPVSVTLAEKTNKEVKAELKRVAAKVILDLKVAKEVEQTHTNAAGLEEYTKTWYADIEHIQIYMLWGSTHGNLAGTPVTYSTEHQDWFYFASPRYAMYSNPDGGEYDSSINAVRGTVDSSLYSDTDFLSQSTVWDYVYVVDDTQGDAGWIWNSNLPSDATADWKESHKGDFYYGDWAYVLDGEGEKQIQTYVDEDDGTTKQERRATIQTEKKTYYAISSLPLYSMPISWNVNDAHAPFIKVILPWQGYNKETGEYDMKNGVRKTTEFYYKILVPKRSTLDANGCYHISLDLSVLGSEADEVPVLVNGEYHVVGWNEAVKMGGDQSAGRYLNCATSFEFYSQNEMEIPVSSSHDIEIVGTPTATYQDYSTTTATTGTLTYSTTSSTANNFTVTTTGTSKVTVSHTMETNLDDMESYDVSPITYTFTIQHKGEGGSAYQKTIKVTQYPSLYIRADLNSNYLRGQYNYDSDLGYVYINGGQNSNASNWYYTGGLQSYTNTGNANPNMYVITTSVVAPSLSYVLGDPRSGTINNFTSRFTSASAPAVGETNNRQLRYYYPTDTSDETINMIAPSFRIVSSYGRFGYAQNFESAENRCATYQEDGYPAGRWRIPTKAELEYITTLSAKGLIPSLFNVASGQTASRYWSAHALLQVNTNGTVSELNQTTGFARCVYDEWYWSVKDAEGNETNIVDKQTFTWGDKQR